MTKWLMIIAAAFVLFVGGTAHAEDESPTSEMMLLSGGIICDTMDQLTAFLAQDGSEGCGRLQIPVYGTVTALGEFETNGHRFMLAEYNFVNPPGFPTVQYGYWGSPVPIEVEPAGMKL